MNCQSKASYSGDSWDRETLFGVTHGQMMWVIIWLAIAVAYGTMDWDHVLGRRDHTAVKTVIKK